MKPIPISVQLYSVREAAAKDFPGVLRQIAAMGYAGVEYAGLHGMEPQAVRALTDELGMVASSNHGAMPNEQNADEIVKLARTLGYTRHIAGFGPDKFETKESTLAAAAIAQKAAEALKGSGITFGLHNHDWEFNHVFDGRTAHAIMMEAAPDVFAQLDTYWVQVGGADPAAVIADYGSRAPVLHIKDGPCDRAKAMTAIGDGVMDWARIMRAVPASTEWLIVELDRCDTDMMAAVAKSYQYLTSHGYARGRQ